MSLLFYKHLAACLCYASRSIELPLLPNPCQTAKITAAARSALSVRHFTSTLVLPCCSAHWQRLVCSPLAANRPAGRCRRPARDATATGKRGNGAG